MRAEHAPPALLLNTMTDLLHHYHWLASDEGTRSLDRAAAMRADGVTDLKIGERLRAELDPERAALVLTQLDLRERAASRFAHPERMLFTRAGLEQATSEHIARYRANRLAGSERIVDLCCGIGGDLMAMAGLGVPLVAVDLDPVHLFLAEHNARARHPHADITTILADVREVEIAPGDTVFIDPARRLESGKRIGYQSEPPVEWSLALADHAAKVAIKTAPGIPNELLPEGWEMEHIALGNDLKEAVLWSPALAGEFAQYREAWPHRATVIVNGEPHSIYGSHIDILHIVRPQPGQWLHDVNPAVTNAGLVRELAEMIDANLIDPEIGFMVSNNNVHSPFCTSWHILDVLPWHEKQVKQALKALDAGPVDIRRRGLAGDVPAITKRLRGSGNRRIMVAMTRVNGEPTAIICTF